MMSEPLIMPSSAQFNGPFSVASRLIDTIGAAPFEGLWTPTMWSKQASIEVNGIFSVGTIDVYGTNSPNFPQNTYTITVGGTVNTGDIVSGTVTNPNLPGGQATVSYTIGASSSFNSVAASLAAAFNASAALQAIGLTAFANGAVVTLLYPSIQPSSANYGPSEALNPPSNPTIVSAGVAAGGTETLTVGLGTDGTILTAISAIGLTFITMPVRFIKARLISFTGTSLSALYNGVG
jgi:hypothetical protein